MNTENFNKESNLIKKLQTKVINKLFRTYIKKTEENQQLFRRLAYLANIAECTAKKLRKTLILILQKIIIQSSS